MEYKIVTAYSASGLQSSVNNLISDGWKPMGTHQVIATHRESRYNGQNISYTFEYSQTMIKE